MCGRIFLSAKAQGQGFLRKIKDFIIGATVYDAIRELKERKLLSEYGLMLVVFGDLLGYPVGCYYRFRLLPFWFPKLSNWKRYMLQEVDVTGKLKEH
ncbi:MAG: hypothetical protein ACPLW8_01585 [Candidatus Bathyarchaeales archaeon]